MAYEHPIAVSPYWSKSYPDLWDFESVEDCMALIHGVLRDREKRPEIHALKVANCLRGKSAKDLRDEEMKRVIEKRKENEAYAKMIAEMEAARLLNGPKEVRRTLAVPIFARCSLTLPRSRHPPRRHPWKVTRNLVAPSLPETRERVRKYLKVPKSTDLLNRRGRPSSNNRKRRKIRNPQRWLKRK